MDTHSVGGGQPQLGDVTGILRWDRGKGREGGREEVGERSEQRAASQGSFFRLRMQSEKSRA